MTRIFCRLEKDDKTFNILKKYIEDLNNNVDLFSEDLKIQSEEIKKHIHDYNEDGIKWIDKNAAKERLYLNALKNIAAFFIIAEKDLSWENFCLYVDQYNLIFECLIDKIF